MTKSTFLNRLQQVSTLNRDFAERFVSNDLPRSFRYLPRLNQSFDGNPPKPGEHVFPHDTDPAAPLTAVEVADLLCREDRVPEWIDISIRRVDAEHTYFELLCCGRFTDDDALLYYQDTDFAPFGCKSPSFPPRWSEERDRFDLNSARA